MTRSIIGCLCQAGSRPTLVVRSEHLPSEMRGGSETVAGRARCSARLGIAAVRPRPLVAPLAQPRRPMLLMEPGAHPDDTTSYQTTDGTEARTQERADQVPDGRNGDILHPGQRTRRQAKLRMPLLRLRRLFRIPRAVLEMQGFRKQPR